MSITLATGGSVTSKGESHVTGHGSRQMCLMDRYGFPRSKPKACKRVQGFQTGDLVRASGFFDITTATGKVQGISHRFCTLIQRVDGYTYQKGEAAFPPSA